ncbi:MAG: hypothetical protein ACOYM8_17475, partial [Caulobacterales bacterium]
FCDIRQLIISPNGKYLFGYSNSGAGFIYEISTGHLAARLPNLQENATVHVVGHSENGLVAIIEVDEGDVSRHSAARLSILRINWGSPRQNRILRQYFLPKDRVVGIYDEGAPYPYQAAKFGESEVIFSGLSYSISENDSISENQLSDEYQFQRRRFDRDCQTRDQNTSRVPPVAPPAYGGTLILSEAGLNEADKVRLNAMSLEEFAAFMRRADSPAWLKRYGSYRWAKKIADELAVWPSLRNGDELSPNRGSDVARWALQREARVRSRYADLGRLHLSLRDSQLWGNEVDNLARVPQNFDEWRSRDLVEEWMVMESVRVSDGRASILLRNETGYHRADAVRHLLQLTPLELLRLACSNSSSSFPASLRTEC